MDSTKETLESPMVYGETAVYANEDLVKESGKLTPWNHL